MTTVLSSALLKSAGLKHGFFTKEDPFEQRGEPVLNVAYGRSQRSEFVDLNRQKVVRFLGVLRERAVFSKQQHSAVVQRVEDLDADVADPADALVTSLPSVLLAVYTADCIPLLMADAKANVVAAAHISWKTLKQGLIRATVEEMRNLGAQKILASLGPSIHVQHYTVQPEFLEYFPHDEDCALRTGGRLFFNLRKLAAKRLEQAGVEEKDEVDLDTYENEDLFFSFRRVTERNTPLDGAQASAIVSNP